MKKIISAWLAFLILLAFAGCGANNGQSDDDKLRNQDDMTSAIDDTSPIEKTEFDIQDGMIEVDNTKVLFQSGDYPCEKWDAELGTYHGDAVPNVEVALNVARQVYNGIGRNLDYIPIMIFFDTNDEIWIVTFNEAYDETAETIKVGGDCSIAIQKSDGKILRIWYGE